jgi:hemoglobin-like flavoprotein
MEGDGMTERQVVLVQESWAAVQPISDAAAAMFYGRLFDMAPEVRALFRGDMEEQGRKLMTMIDVAVRGLGRLEEIVPAVQGLGVRHAGYGVRDEHYDIVGASLLWTLEQGLGDAFTGEVADAWAEAYALLATTMRDAASEAVAA